MRRIREDSTPEYNDEFPFGDLDATVRIFSDAVALHIIQQEQVGVVITFDPDGAKILRKFVYQCVERL